MENTQMKPAEMLEQVNKAIAAVLVGGQSYKIGSRSLTRADLSMLKSMRDDLEAQVAAGKALAASQQPLSSSASAPR